jgi:hypothetical protein
MNYKVFYINKKKNFIYAFSFAFSKPCESSCINKMFLDTVQCTGVREIWTISSSFWVDTDLRKLHMVFEKEGIEQLILHKTHVIFVKRSITDLQIHV